MQSMMVKYNNFMYYFRTMALCGAAALSGCAVTPQQASNMSDLQICRMLSGPLLHQESDISLRIEAADRRLDCRQYADRIDAERAAAIRATLAQPTSGPSTCSSTLIGSTVHTTCH